MCSARSWASQSHTPWWFWAVFNLENDYFNEQEESWSWSCLWNSSLPCAVPLPSAALGVNNKSDATGLSACLLWLLGRDNEDWTFPAGVRWNLWDEEKPLQELCCCCWGFEVLLSPQWMGTSLIPSLKGFSISCFSQRCLWNSVIPVNGFQFSRADTSHQGWFVGKFPTKSAAGSQDSWFVVLLHGLFTGG